MDIPIELPKSIHVKLSKYYSFGEVQAMRNECVALIEGNATSDEILGCAYRHMYDVVSEMTVTILKTEDRRGWICYKIVNDKDDVYTNGEISRSLLPLTEELCDIEFSNAIRGLCMARGYKLAV